MATTKGIYLAARYGRQGELRAVARALGVIGFRATSSWVEREYNDSEDVAEALRDLYGIESADIVVSFTEPPTCQREALRGGRHVEFGIALARGKQVMLVGPRENIFHYLPGVLQFDTVSDLLRHLRFAEVKLHAGERPAFEGRVIDVEVIR